MKDVVDKMKNMVKFSVVTKMIESMDNFEKMFDNIYVNANLMDKV